MAKVIAVFADGTGNSAAKLFKTNVWRLYDALDTSDPGSTGQPRQIAYYHDGVGTSSFKPLAILGGAFGWGLKRNVLDLYTFVCRNWEPDDRICAFGFSRGAFAVRLLAGLIAQQGLVANTSEEELEVYARDAYRQYRRRFNPTGGLVTPLRNVRDRLIARSRRLARRQTYAERQADPARANRAVDVDFLGIWDTVAAYGMPIAELTRAVDYWIWPLSMPNYVLSPKVKRARHALALDDERDTFHPLIWDERSETDPERLQQVWFAGMHSDVGGGYPDDSLAYVSLDWMLAEAERAGLRFQADAVAEIRRIMNANGSLHDSRRGLGAYYRYQPRKVAAHVDPPDRTALLMQDPEPKTSAMLRSVKIHESVFRRIGQGTDRYAPIVLPGAYTVVATGGAVAPPPEFEAAKRAIEQERVWDRVWHRRVNYFLTVFVSAHLLLFPAWHALAPPPACVGPQCLLSPAIYAVGALLPAIAEPWIDAFAATPGRAAATLLVLVLLLRRSRLLHVRSRDDMRALWEQSLGLRPETVAPPATAPWVRRLRAHPRYQRFFQWLKWQAAPAVFGVSLLLMVLALVAAPLGVGVLRAGIWKDEYTNAWCPDGSAAEFTTSARCWPLPGTVEAGGRYRVTLTVKQPWADHTIETDPRGFGAARMTLGGNVLAPLRRSLSARWFQPIVKVAGGGGFFSLVPLELQRVDVAEPRYTGQFTAPRTGRAHVFVNDVLLPAWLGAAGDFYTNNAGSATITIESVPDRDRRHGRPAAAPAPLSRGPLRQDHVGGAAGGHEPAAGVGDAGLAEDDGAPALEQGALGVDRAAAGRGHERDVQVEGGLAHAALRSLVHGAERPADGGVDERRVDRAVHGRAGRVAQVVAHGHAQADPALARVLHLDAQELPEAVGPRAVARGGEQVGRHGAPV